MTHSMAVSADSVAVSEADTKRRPVWLKKRRHVRGGAGECKYPWPETGCHCPPSTLVMTKSVTGGMKKPS